MIVDRIREVIKYKGISARSFYQRIGVANGFLDKAKDVGSEKLARIASEFPEIDPVWLLTGSGSMLKTDRKADGDNTINQIAGDNGSNTLQLGGTNRRDTLSDLSMEDKTSKSSLDTQNTAGTLSAVDLPKQGKMHSEREQALETVIAELKSQLKSQESMIEWMKEQHGWLKKQYEDQVERNKTLTSKSPSGE